MSFSRNHCHVLPVLLIVLYSCGQAPERNKNNYLIDNSLSSQIGQKIELFNKQANSNISFKIFANDKEVVASQPDGEPALSFTTFIENSAAVECLNGIEDGFGFSLIINPDTTILKFKVVSNSDQVLFKEFDSDTLKPELLVPCVTKKIILTNQPQIKSGEIIEGKVELESDNFYEVSKDGTRKLKFKLVAFFQAEPLPIVDKQYKTLNKVEQ